MYKLSANFSGWFRLKCKWRKPLISSCLQNLCFSPAALHPLRTPMKTAFLRVCVLPKIICTEITKQFIYYKYLLTSWCRSQWPRGLRQRSAAARLLGSWVRIPPGAWMFVCCECCVLSGRGLCEELITRLEESYQLWRVVVCDLETSWMSKVKVMGASGTGAITFTWGLFRNVIEKTIWFVVQGQPSRFIANHMAKGQRQGLRSWTAAILDYSRTHWGLSSQKPTNKQTNVLADTCQEVFLIWSRCCEDKHPVRTRRFEP